MKFVKKRILRQGNSLVVVLTPECRELGIVPDDEILIAIEKSGFGCSENRSENRIEIPTTFPTPFEGGYDPSVIGQKVLSVTDSRRWNDDELRSLIRTRDRDPKHVEAILLYVRMSE